MVSWGLISAAGKNGKGKKMQDGSVGGGVSAIGILLYLGIVWRFHGDDPCFGDFQSDWVPIFYTSTRSDRPSFCRNNQFVSIIFSSRDARN